MCIRDRGKGEKPTQCVHASGVPAAVESPAGSVTGVFAQTSLARVLPGEQNSAIEEEPKFARAKRGLAHKTSLLTPTGPEQHD